LLSTLLSFTFDFVAPYEPTFILYLSATFFVNGAIFVSPPIYFAKVYGPETGIQAYAFFFTANSISMLILSVIVNLF
jgi:hypothetical protein